MVDFQGCLCFGGCSIVNHFTPRYVQVGTCWERFHSDTCFPLATAKPRGGLGVGLVPGGLRAKCRRKCFHPSIHPSIIHSSVHPSIHPFTYPSIHLSMHAFVHSSFHPSSIHLSIHPSIQWLFGAYPKAGSEDIEHNLQSCPCEHVLAPDSFQCSFCGKEDVLAALGILI